MVEYNEVYSDVALIDKHVRVGMLAEQGREGWIFCGLIPPTSVDKLTAWIFYREVPDPTPDGEAIGQMVQEDTSEEKSGNCMMMSLSEAAGRLKQASEAGKITIGDHGEPEPVMSKTILVQPLGRSDDEIQEMVQRIYSTPDPQETFYQMWSRMIAVPAKYLWPDDPKKS
jgi:hypothetical protein